MGIHIKRKAKSGSPLYRLAMQMAFDVHHRIGALSWFVGSERQLLDVYAWIKQ
jgi:hypothetical protein